MQLSWLVACIKDDIDVLAMVSMVGKDRIVEIFVVVLIKLLCVDYSGVPINLDDSSKEEEEVQE